MLFDFVQMEISISIQTRLEQWLAHT
ncbi:hypothetical protein ELI_05690 [Erythrobacter litoralis HTCC2594]|uniref:Uncharacterized protein n=1 Tax=Erythrobacter litoralis (strain HTCC2594) TaxID=314225 RepID=Q2NAR1_ERYLH|nr:hypothetical protein ELI_05690 [Erythrobacter litoralis HTCC2594]